MLLSNFRNAITSYYPILKDMAGNNRSNTTTPMHSSNSETPYARANGGSVIVGGGLLNPHLMIIN